MLQSQRHDACDHDDEYDGDCYQWNDGNQDDFADGDNENDGDDDNDDDDRGDNNNNSDGTDDSEFNSSIDDRFGESASNINRIRAVVFHFTSFCIPKTDSIVLAQQKAYTSFATEHGVHAIYINIYMHGFFYQKRTAEYFAGSLTTLGFMQVYFTRFA